VLHATVVRFEAKTSESGLIARLGDGLAVGAVVGVDVAAGRIVGDGLGDAAPIDGTVDGDTAPMDAAPDGDAGGTLVGDDPQPARTNATARTAVPRATITRPPPDQSSPRDNSDWANAIPKSRRLLEPNGSSRAAQLRATTKAMHAIYERITVAGVRERWGPADSGGLRAWTGAGAAPRG
jgi:hypothetical protein